MFGFSFNRRVAIRPTRTPAIRRSATFEPLESRQLLSGTVSPAVDAGLTVIYTKTTLPTAVLSGSKIKGAVTLQLTNSTTINDTGVNTFAIYASLDNVIDTTIDPVLGTLSRKVNIKAGKSLNVTIPVKNIPAPTTGDYNVLISATDASGVTSTTEITPSPSLDVSPATIVLNPVIGAATPTALTAGKTITFKATVTNSGNTNSTGPLTAVVGLSLDSTTIPITLKSFTRNVTIKSNSKAVSFTYRVKIPVGTAPGVYFPAITFTQGTASQVTAFSTSSVTVGV